LRAFAADDREAWAFLRRRRAFLLFTLMETTLLAAFFAIQNTLGLVFIEQALGRTVVDASLFFGCLALGAALAGLVVSRLGGRLTDKLRLVGPALLVDGVLLAVFSLNTIFPLTVVLTVFLGVIGAIIDIVYVTIVQAEAPQDLQGKVFALRAFAIGVVAPVAIAVGAALADVVEIQWIFLACAVAEIGLALVLLGAMRAEERRSS
jgi:MFS family permease